MKYSSFKTRSISITAVLLACLLLLAALPCRAASARAEGSLLHQTDEGVPPCTSGGHDIMAFIRWALTHAKRETIPAGAELPLAVSQCGTDPWEYLYGGIRARTDDETLAFFYNTNYNRQMTPEQYADLTADWSRTGWATDCQGLLDAFMTYVEGEQTDINVAMNYAYWCTDKGPIDEIDRPYRIGEALFCAAKTTGRMTHIGWVCGFDSDGTPLAIEARGISYGVVVTRMDHRSWTHRGLMTVVFDYPDLPETPGACEPAAIVEDASVPAVSGKAPDELWFGGGSGTEADPYRISAPEHLMSLAEYVGSGHPCTGCFFLMTNDIVFEEFTIPASVEEEEPPERTWTPIGFWNTNNDCCPFRGHFDGGGHTLSGLWYSDTDTSFVGFIGYAGEGCTVENLNILHSYFHALDNVGGVAGCVSGACTLRSCRFSGRLSGELWVGGIAGAARGAANIVDCASSGVIEAVWAAGGTAGQVKNAAVSRCFSVCELDVSDAAGGLVGQFTGGSFTNCYFAGFIEGVTEIGGNIGRAAGGSVSCCYSVASLDIKETGGGLIGGGEAACEYCYYLSGTAAPNGFGEERSILELQTRAGYEGFDFERIWLLELMADYPYAALRSNPHFEVPNALPGDVDHSGSVNMGDALMALRFAMGISEASEAEYAAADMDSSGAVTVTDAILIMRRAMGL